MPKTKVFLKSRQEVIDYLIYYNNWRRDNNGKFEAPNPTQLGICIDCAIKYLKKGNKE